MPTRLGWRRCWRTRRRWRMPSGLTAVHRRSTSTTRLSTMAACLSLTHVRRPYTRWTARGSRHSRRRPQESTRSACGGSSCHRTPMPFRTSSPAKRCSWSCRGPLAPRSTDRSPMSAARRTVASSSRLAILQVQPDRGRSRAGSRPSRTRPGGSSQAAEHPVEPAGAEHPAVARCASAVAQLQPLRIRSCWTDRATARSPPGSRTRRTPAEPDVRRVGRCGRAARLREADATSRPGGRAAR